MFYKYTTNNINGVEVLYLYLSFKYEFSNEFLNDDKLLLLSRNYIISNNINFKGKTIYYVVDGIVVKRLDITRDESIISDYFSPDNYLINIMLDDNSVCEITLREYLLSILFDFYNSEFPIEVYKCICILYNTYVYKQMNEDNYIKCNSIFNDYKYYKEYRDIYNNYYSLINSFNEIINSVSCMYMQYNNNYILPFIHYCNSGRTRTNKKYPYLTSVKSIWDITSSNYINVVKYSYEDINKLFKISINNKSKIYISNNGTIINMDNYKISISEFKNILKLNSNDISIIVNNNYIEVITKGIGNSYGLSLFGASCIAKNGGTYYNILNYYFPKVKLYKYIKKLS